MEILEISNIQSCVTCVYMLHHPSFIECLTVLLTIQIKIWEKLIPVTVLFD
jgi:hypothetical protein